MDLQIVAVFALFWVGLAVSMLSYLGTPCYTLSKNEKLTFQRKRELIILGGAVIMIVAIIGLLFVRP